MYKVKSKSAEINVFSIYPTKEESKQLKEYKEAVEEFEYTDEIISKGKRKVRTYKINRNKCFQLSLFPENTFQKEIYLPMLYCQDYKISYNKSNAKKYDEVPKKYNKPRIKIDSSLNTVEAVEIKLEEIIQKKIKNN